MKRRNPAKIADATVRYLLLAAGTVVFTLPMIYMISTSLRPNGALYEYPPRFFPKWEALTLENYDYILHQSKFYLNFLNSVVVSLSTVALAAAVSSAMAFVLGKFKSRATQLLFGFIIVTMIIPGTTMSSAVRAGNGLGAGQPAVGTDSVLCGMGNPLLDLHDQGIYGEHPR